MKGVMGFSGKKTTSIVFLLAILFIALALSSVTFLINDNASSMPNVGFEGNANMEDAEEMKNKKEGMKHIKEGMKHKKEGMKNKR